MSIPICTPNLPHYAAKQYEQKRAAATAAFLLSPRSSGINAQRMVVDAGMEVNYFDQELVTRCLQSD